MFTSNTVRLRVENLSGSSNVSDYERASSARFLFTSGPALAAGKVGAPYSGVLETTGAASEVQSWSILAGFLPPGIMLAPEGSSLLIKGTPASAGTYHFSVGATDMIGGSTNRDSCLKISGPIEIPPNGVVNAASLRAEQLFLARS